MQKLGAALVSGQVPGSGAAGSSAVRRALGDVPHDATEYAVRMRDGVLLATDVYLPAPGGRRWPTLLARLPYDKDGDECLMPDVARWFVDRGFAVVVQDTRGKARSGGTFEPFRHEDVDGYDTIEWITQQRWCDGRVGMIGDSYYGYTQFAAAAAGHPALRAIAPRVSSPNLGADMARGVFRLELVACWAFETLLDEFLYDGEIDWSVRPQSEIVPTALGGARISELDRLALGRGVRGARIRADARVPALHLAAWWDPFQRSQIDGWRRRRRAGRAPQHLFIEAADHGWMPAIDPGTMGEDPRSSANALDRFLERYLRPHVGFFDRFLLEGTTEVLPSVRWHQTWDGWRTADDWPPPGVRPQRFHLVGGPQPALAGRPDARERAMPWIHSPLDPVPSLMHPYYSLLVPPDERSTEVRGDVVMFTSDPVRQPLDLVGPLSAKLRMASSARSTHVMAKVCDVYPDGRVLRIGVGATHVAGPWPRDVVVHLGYCGYRIRAGHSLRLEVTASLFPQFILHPGTDEHPWTASTFREQQLTLWVGDRSSWLRCFVLPSDGSTGGGDGQR